MLEQLFANDLKVFSFCAYAGTAILTIQLVLNLFGLWDEGVEDYKQFKWLSIQAAAGFMMFFGWTALACKKELGMSNQWTLALAIGAGILTVLLVRTIFTQALKLHSSGNQFKLEEAVGKEAIVYQRIPMGGVGKVSVSLREITYEVDAVAENEIASFKRVHIIKKLDDNTVSVLEI